jgi:hypothetical protein
MEQANKHSQPHMFQPEQRVLLDEHTFLNKNQTLAPKWSGQHQIKHLRCYLNVELELRHNKGKLLIHANCLKPYLVPDSTTRNHVPNQALETEPLPEPESGLPTTGPNTPEIILDPEPV